MKLKMMLQTRKLSLPVAPYSFTLPNLNQPISFLAITIPAKIRSRFNLTLIRENPFESKITFWR